MVNTQKPIPQEDWDGFVDLVTIFFENISDDFKKNNPENEKPVATCIIAFFILLRFKEDDILEYKTLPLRIKIEHRAKVLVYLKSKNLNFSTLLTLVLNNWTNCPPYLRNLLIKFNQNIQFPTSDFIEANKPLANPTLIKEEGNIQMNQIQFSERERAILKYISEVLIDLLGYRFYSEFEEIFKDNLATDFVYYDGRQSIITIADFKSLREKIKLYASANYPEWRNMTKSTKLYAQNYVKLIQKISQDNYYEPIVSDLNKLEQTKKSLKNVKNDDSLLENLDEINESKDNYLQIETVSMILSNVEKSELKKFSLILKLLPNSETLLNLIDELIKRN
jgi:hypothetical protein